MPGVQRTGVIVALAVVLAAFACLAVRPAWQHPVTWTPDGLYYQARLLELKGVPHDKAIARTFAGPISKDLRRRDPQHVGNPSWVAYNEPFYHRRIAVPLAGSVLYRFAGDRSLLDLSLAGFVAAIVALFGLLLLRFRIATAALVTAATILLQPLRAHSSFPLTDSWGLALEITAFAAALLVWDRGRRWLPLWIGAIALLAFTRDSAWIPILAAGWWALRNRNRDSLTLLGTGIAAALPAVVLFSVPARDLLALLVNNSEPSADTSLGFILRHYPHAVVELVRANVGFLRRGEWYTAAYLVGGVLALLGLLWKRAATRSPSAALMAAGAVVGLGYVLAAPSFSAFRLELVFVPMAAYGLALVTDTLLSRIRALDGIFGALAVSSPGRARR
jgi:hypothetical protein